MPLPGRNPNSGLPTFDPATRLPAFGCNTFTQWFLLTPCATQCTPTDECNGTGATIVTNSDSADLTGANVGKVVKVFGGKCYTVSTRFDDGTPATVLGVTPFDSCAECCDDKPNYRLSQCSGRAENDCNGESTDIVVPYSDALGAANGKTVKYNGKCWDVAETCDAADHAAIDTSGTFDDCDECCEGEDASDVPCTDCSGAQDAAFLNDNGAVFPCDAGGTVDFVSFTPGATCKWYWDMGPELPITPALTITYTTATGVWTVTVTTANGFPQYADSNVAGISCKGSGKLEGTFTVTGNNLPFDCTAESVTVTL